MLPSEWNLRLWLCLVLEGRHSDKIKLQKRAETLTGGGERVACAVGLPWPSFGRWVSTVSCCSASACLVYPQSCAESFELETQRPPGPSCCLPCGAAPPWLYPFIVQTQAAGLSAVSWPGRRFLLASSWILLSTSLGPAHLLPDFPDWAFVSAAQWSLPRSALT